MSFLKIRHQPYEVCIYGLCLCGTSKTGVVTRAGSGWTMVALYSIFLPSDLLLSFVAVDSCEAQF